MLLTDPVNVKFYGAVGDGVTDDTAAIQTAFNTSKVIHFPAGRYIVSNTLMLQGDAKITGDGPEITILQRTANYGNTFNIGTTGAGLGALAFSIEGLWFYKPQTGTPGATSISHPVAANAAHIQVIVGAACNIKRCWFSTMPYGITFQQTTVFTVEDCKFNGLWDPKTPALQEAKAAIWVKSTGGYNVSGVIRNNYIAGGYASASRPVTIGATTINFSESIGTQVGLQIDTCEDLLITGNYFGGQSNSCIELNRQNILSGVRITDNFFDAATVRCINTTTSGDPIVSLIIANNEFNGQTYGKEALRVQNPGNVNSVVKLIMANNSFENFATCPIILSGVTGGLVTGNSISAYNFFNGYPGSADQTSGIYINGTTNRVFCNGNQLGGGVNYLSPTNTGSSPNKCQWGIFATAAGLATAANTQNAGLGLSGGGLTVNV